MEYDVFFLRVVLSFKVSGVTSPACKLAGWKAFRCQHCRWPDSSYDPPPGRDSEQIER